MKLRKSFFRLLLIALIASLCGCASTQQDAESDAAPSPSVSAAEPEPTPVPKTAPEYHFTDAIQQRGVLTVAVSSNSSLNYTIPNDPDKYGALANTRDGYVPQLCRQIAESLGVAVEFVEYETLEAQLQAVVDGDVDLAADNFLINAQRLALYEMTDSFNVTQIEGDQVFLSTNPQPWMPATEAGSDGDAEPIAPEPRQMIQSQEALDHARIAVVKGSAQAANAARQYPEAELYALADNQEVLEALIAGQVDAGVFSMLTNAFIDQIVQAITQGTVAQSSYEIAIADEQGFGMILMKGNAVLCQSINALLSDLKQSGWLLACYESEKTEAIERGII